MNRTRKTRHLSLAGQWHISGLSPEDRVHRIIQALLAPELRLADHPEIISLGRQLLADPEDAYLAELWDINIQSQQFQATIADDPYRENYPGKDALPAPVEPGVCLGRMPTGDSIYLPVSRLVCNLGVIGRTGGGKSSLLKHLVRSLVTHQNNTGSQVTEPVHLLVFERKPEWSHLLADPLLTGQVAVLSYHQLQISPLQPPPAVPFGNWANEFVRIFGLCYGRLFAPRLLREIITEATSGCRENYWPPLSELTDRMRQFRPGRGFREAAFKESNLGVLVDMINHFQDIFEYTRSDFVEKLFSRRGLTVIQTLGLGNEHYAFLIMFLLTWLRTYRIFNP